MAFEAAAFDLLSDDELKHSKNIAALIAERTSLLASKLNIDSSRLLSWIYVRVIMSAQWFCEDGGDPNKMMVLANILYSMCNLNCGTC